MKIDITPVDLALVITRLADYCTLLELTSKPNEDLVKDYVQEIKELASRLQAQRIIY
jgi:hypothetical protein